MTKDKIEYISSFMSETEHWRKIGGWGSLIMFAAPLIDLWFRSLGAGSLLFESALLRGFAYCWGSNFDRHSKFKKEPDGICFKLLW